MLDKIINTIPTLLASLVGSIITLLISFLNKKLEKSGELSISCKFVYTKGSEHHGFEYDIIQDRNKQILYIPIWVDIVNNSDVSKVCRNLSVCSYRKGVEIEEFVQIQKEETGDKEFYYGDKGVYSFVIPANSVCRYELLFSKVDFDTDIDSFVMQYITNSNRIIKYKLIDLDEEWKDSLSIYHTNKWFTLKNKVKRCFWR